MCGPCIEDVDAAGYHARADVRTYMTESVRSVSARSLRGLVLETTRRFGLIGYEAVETVELLCSPSVAKLEIFAAPSGLPWVRVGKGQQS